MKKKKHNRKSQVSKTGAGDNKLWCEVCSEYFLSADHIHCTPHNMEISLTQGETQNKRLQTETNQNQQNVEQQKQQTSFNLGKNHIKPSNIGFKLLLAQGWKTTQGLGKLGQGRRVPILPKVKHDKLGIGINPMKTKEKRRKALEGNSTVVSNTSTHSNANPSEVQVNRPLSGRKVRELHKQERDWTKQMMKYMST